MNTQERIEQLERELNELKDYSTLIRINGIPQKVVHHGAFGKVKKVWQPKLRKEIYIDPVHIIEVVDK